MRGADSHPLSGRRVCRGFTLIELLVVVAVIGILAALLMPAVLGALRSAASANCKSNLRQIAAGFMAYVQNHDGFMPPSGSPGNNPPHKYPHWCKNLEPFVHDPGVFRCPAKEKAKYGYGLNHMWCGPDHIYGEGTAMNNRSKEIEAVVNPSATIIICDTGYVTNKDEPDPAKWIETGDANNNGCTRYPYDNKLGPATGQFIWWDRDPRRAVPRHSASKTNCQFFDGHVDGLVTLDIVDDLWDEPGCLYDNDRHPKRPD